MAIHDVNMQQICSASFDRGHFVGQAGKVGRIEGAMSAVLAVMNPFVSSVPHKSRPSNPRFPSSRNRLVQ
jgi:hypothetical protein